VLTWLHVFADNLLSLGITEFVKNGQEIGSQSAGVSQVHHQGLLNLTLVRQGQDRNRWPVFGVNGSPRHAIH
jgi:hypothetical protein